MKKAFDQTFRDIKRGVNKKVLKVPGVEQKVLDATSNEAWGPHGSLLADIAHASKNFNDYQLIMTIIWKRINDTGKNWRHVYKGLTVLEYLVAHGSERVIEEIKEHSYQISTLSDFQYIDSSGRDQGSNVRKKSQSLVILVNDKERILEVRQKAASNRDKFSNTSSTGGMYKPSSYSGSGGYGDRYEDEGRYGSREDDRNGNGGEDDRYGKLSENSSRDGDRYGRDYEESYGKDGNREDDYQGRGRSGDDYNHSQRSRSSDRDRDHADDDGNSSARGSGARADDHSQDGRPLDRKFSEQNLGAPPSYEEAVNDARSPVNSERGGEISAASAPKAASPPSSSSPTQATTEHVSVAPLPPTNEGVDTFDEFDPRGSFSAAPSTSNSVEMDLLGSLLEPSPSNALALVSSTPEADTFAYSDSSRAFSETSLVNQTFEDPFGDTPFKATPSWESGNAAQISEQPSHLQPQVPSFPSEVDSSLNFNFADTFAGISYAPNPSFMSQEMSAPNKDFDILADILPPSGPSATLPTLHPSFTAQPPNPNVNESFYPDSGSLVPVSYFAPQVPSGQTALNSGFPPHSEFTGPVGSEGAPQVPNGPTAPHNSAFPPHSEFAGPVAASQLAPQVPSGTAAHYNGASFFQPSGSNAPIASYVRTQVSGPVAPSNVSNFLSQSGYSAPVASHTGIQTPAAPTTTNYMNSQTNNLASTGQLAIIPQPSKDKFETKSTVWTDTLNRGLVNLNISGAKTNPLSDIGIDFDAINRKEKRLEKHVATAPAASTVHMGKAMGSGSGIGRAGALRPSSNPMMGMGMGGAPNPGMGMGMGMGMGGAPNPGMGMGGAPNPGMGIGMAPNGGMDGYGGMNQQMGMGMGMGGYGGMNQQPMGMGMGMNMGMNMGMGQGAPMQPQAGMQPGSTMQGGYNPMMGGGGAGGFPSQQPYGGGY